jgi:hypothetical protein
MLRIFLGALVLSCTSGGLAFAQEKTTPAETAQSVIHRPDVALPSEGKTADAAHDTSAAQALPPEAHPWGRFPVGSWKVVRLTTETLDATGHVTATTISDTKTTLIEATDQDYALRVEVTVDVGGRRFAHPAQVTRHSYWGELAATPAGVRKVSTSEIELNGKKVPCELRQVVTEQAGQRRQSQIHYSPTIYPYVLKRESIVTPTEGSALTTSVETVASNLPQKVLGILRPIAFVRTSRQLPKGDSLTMETQSPDIPGGVIAHSALERDAASVVVRRTSLELLEYGVGSESPEEASPGRRRWFRSRGRRGDDANPPRRDR